MVSLQQDQRSQNLGDVVLPTVLVQHEDILGARWRQQNVQPEGEIGLDLATIFRNKQSDDAFSSATVLAAFDNDFKPYENFRIIRLGEFTQEELARLVEGTDAAAVWTNNQAVQLILDGQSANAQVGVQKVSTIYTVDAREGKAKVRITKVASTGFAKPGDVVDFTLRFDNVGTKTVGNVTILDNLTTRLEYVPDSAQCSLPANFLTEPSESDSLVLRWEITNPLPHGEGGIIRFRCRVR